MTPALRFLAGAGAIALGLYQIYVIATLIYPEWGLIGLVVGYLIFPFTLIWAPLFAGMALGDWSYLWFYPASLGLIAFNTVVRGLSIKGRDATA